LQFCCQTYCTEFLYLLGLIHYILFEFTRTLESSTDVSMT
jgi:hypothetical protein